MGCFYWEETVHGFSGNTKYSFPELTNLECQCFTYASIKWIGGETFATSVRTFKTTTTARPIDKCLLLGLFNSKTLNCAVLDPLADFIHSPLAAFVSLVYFTLMMVMSRSSTTAIIR